MTSPTTSRRANRRPVTTTLAAVMALALLAACGSGGDDNEPTTDAPDASTPWSTIEADAKTDGEVTVWGELSTDVAASLQKAFKADHPDIDITITSILPPNLTTKVDAEHAANQATVDVVIQTNRAWHDSHGSDGYFAPILSPEVKKVDEELRDGTVPRTEGAPVSTQILYNNGQTLAAIFGPYGYAWNKERVATPPASFEALFADETFKGRIGMNAPDASTTTTGLYELIAERYPDVFKELGKLNPTYYPNGSSLTQAMTAGAVDVAFTLNPSLVDDTMGFAFDTAHPVPATANYTQIMDSAPHPNAAQVFVDWLVREGGAAALADNTFVPVIDTPGGGMSISDVELYEEVAPTDAKRVQDEIKVDLGR